MQLETSVKFFAKRGNNKFTHGDILLLIFTDSWGVHTDSETDTDHDMLDADHDNKLKEKLPTFPDLLVGFATCAGWFVR